MDYIVLLELQRRGRYRTGYEERAVR